MAKLSSNMTDKLKDMARRAANEERIPSPGFKGVAEKIKQQSQAHKKTSIGSDKLSGRKS